MWWRYRSRCTRGASMRISRPGRCNSARPNWRESIRSSPRRARSSRSRPPEARRRRASTSVAMKVFHCSHCHHLVFFENTQCVNCGFKLAFVPELADMAAMEPLENGLWRTGARGAEQGRFRLCRNYSDENICNWSVADEDPEALCESCRLTEVIPNLTLEGNHEAWFKLEAAKRRLIYSLKQLHCPVESRLQNPERGLAYKFLSDGDADSPILTGHTHGVVSVNIAEAGDAERERRRVQLGEPYRTLLGHFRHEVGHYYWERLVYDRGILEQFRAMFGDERADYAAA